MNIKQRYKEIREKNKKKRMETTNQQINQRERLNQLYKELKERKKNGK